MFGDGFDAQSGGDFDVAEFHVMARIPSFSTNFPAMRNRGDRDEVWGGDEDIRFTSAQQSNASLYFGCTVAGLPVGGSRSSWPKTVET